MKRMLSRLVLTLLVVIGVTTLTLRSTPVPALDLDALTKDSSLIVTGEIASVREVGKTKLQFNGEELDARVGAGTIRVNQVLKGNAPAQGVSFQIYTSDAYIGWRSPSTNSYAIYFLKADSSGNTQFTSPYYPDVPTVPTPVVSDGAPIDKVIAAIKEVLSSPETTPDQKKRTIFILSHCKRASATAALREALNDSTQEVQISAAAALLLRNDTTGLGIAKETLLHGSQIASTELRQNLICAIAEGIKDPKAVPTLSELLVSPDAEVRRAVASSLMHIRAPEAINLMISLLDDSDFEARYYAVVGLAETTDQMDWRPNMDNFRGD
jgi:hypothetical protein